MLFTPMKINCCISLSCLHSGTQSCFQATPSPRFPFFRMPSYLVFPVPQTGFLAILVSWLCSSGGTLWMEIVRSRVQPRNRAGIGTALFRNSVASRLGTSVRSAMMPVMKTSSRWMKACSRASGRIRSTADLDTR